MDLYLEASGPPGLTKIEGAAYRRGAHMGGFTVVSAARGQKDCAQTIQINGMSLLPGSMEKFVGKKYTVSVYGTAASLRPSAGR